MNEPRSGEAALVYDGECPFCSRYVQMVRLRQSLGPVRLINARDGGQEVERLVREGYDLDEGMALLWQGEVYHGADCINRIALLSTSSGIFNRINAAIFRSPTLSKLLYPMLRAGRNAVLRLLGRTRIRAPEAPKLSLRRYRSASIAVFLAMIAYLALAEAKQYPLLDRLPGANSGEVFPFFSWSLFSNPKRFNTRYSVEIVEGRPESDAEAFEGAVLATTDADFLETIRFQKVVRDYLDQIEDGHAALAETRRPLIDNFLRDFGVSRYRLVRITFNPMEPVPPVSAEIVTEIFEIQPVGVPAQS